MIRLGLTGSMAMGKSSVAAMLRRAGVPVFEADQAVHRLLAAGGDAVAAVAAAFPGCAASSGAAAGGIDRRALGQRVFGDGPALDRLEAILHPLVRRMRDDFIARQKASGADLVALDIPLLLETGGAEQVDLVVVVSADAATQRQRALARPGMTEERLAFVLARQMDDAEKRRRADVVIDNSGTPEATEDQVRALLHALAAAGHDVAVFRRNHRPDQSRDRRRDGAEYSDR
ncbi:MAG: dephospho-CoA kinase [Alphaproteobacteria bacterium]